MSVKIKPITEEFNCRKIGLIYDIPFDVKILQLPKINGYLSFFDYKINNKFFYCIVLTFDRIFKNKNLKFFDVEGHHPSIFKIIGLEIDIPVSIEYIIYRRENPYSDDEDDENDNVENDNVGDKNVEDIGDKNVGDVGDKNVEDVGDKNVEDVGDKNVKDI